MKVIVINLIGADERANHINSQLNKQGIFHTFFRGLNNNKFRLMTLGKKHIFGLTGCYISHLLAWQNNITNDYLMIVEDDYVLPNDFMIQVRDYIKTLPIDTDFAFLFWGKINSKYKKESEIEINKDWMKTNGIWSTACYLVNTKNIQKIEKVLGENIVDHIDIAIDNKGYEGELNVYFLNKPIGSLSGLKSQIGHE